MVERLRTVRFETWCAGVVAAAFFALYAYFRHRYVSGCDEAAYLSESFSLRGLDPTLRGALRATDFPALVPLCHTLLDDEVVGIFPLGFPALIALFGLVGAETYVPPAAGAASILLMYVAASRIVGRPVACGIAAVWGAVPLVTWGGVSLMSDLPATTALVATAALLSGNRPIAGGVALGLSLGIRPTNALFVPFALASVSSRSGRFGFCVAVACGGAAWPIVGIATLGIGGPWHYLEANSGALGTARYFSQAWFLVDRATRDLWPLLPLVAVAAVARPRVVARYGVWVGAFVAFYALWLPPWHSWWEARMILPAYPAVFLAAAHGLAVLAGRRFAKPLATWAVRGLAWVAALGLIARGLSFSEKEGLFRRDALKAARDDSVEIQSVVPDSGLVGAMNLTYPIRYYGHRRSFDYRHPGAAKLIDAAFDDGLPVYAAIEPQNYDALPAVIVLRERYVFDDGRALSSGSGFRLRRILQRAPPSLRRPGVVAAHGLDGDPAWVFDGRAPDSGRPWDASGTVVFSTEGSFIVFKVPPRSLVLEILADGNDRYSLSSSRDGESFESTATVPEVHAFGLQKREIVLPVDAGSWLRIQPLAGDGQYSIAEISVIALAPARSRARGTREGARR